MESSGLGCRGVLTIGKILSEVLRFRLVRSGKGNPPSPSSGKMASFSFLLSANHSSFGFF